MSVIGYITQCQNCDVRMLVTAEARDMRHCPPCLNDLIIEAIDTAEAKEAAESQPYDPPLLPWERELLGRNDDDDYPLGEVSI